MYFLRENSYHLQVNIWTFWLIDQHEIRFFFFVDFWSESVPVLSIDAIHYFALPFNSRSFHFNKRQSHLSQSRFCLFAAQKILLFGRQLSIDFS